MTVSLTKTLHIHVGSNIPGFGPENDPWCVEDISTALGALKEELRDFQDFAWSGCADLAPEGCECAWCDVAADCEAAIGSIADGDAEHYMETGGASFLIRTPEGSDVAFWASVLRTPRCKCEMNEDDL